MNNASRTLGAGGPAVSRLCLGTSAWSGERFGAGPVEPLESVLDELAIDGSSATITFIDTSNEYGGDASERYIGDAIRSRGGAPEPLVIQTKLDRDRETGSFGTERMWRSLLESVAKLGLEHIPLLYLHDPELMDYDASLAADGPVRALVEMKERGIADRIGISGGPSPMLLDYVKTGLFDAVITHNRFTLVDRTSEELVDESVSRGMSVMNAAVYGGGALMKWPAAVERYAYRPAAPAMIDAINAMGAACGRAGVTLGAAALQFSTRDPRITSTVIGANTDAQLQEAIASDAVVIPDALWAELDTLVPSHDLWQNPPGTAWKGPSA
jgi:D-threo-aldose 1-dehydrogenase